MSKPTLAEYLETVKRQYRERGIVKCPSCFGDGTDCEDSSRPCDECGGDGVVRRGPKPTLAQARVDVEVLLKMVNILYPIAIIETDDAAALEARIQALVPEEQS